MDLETRIAAVKALRKDIDLNIQAVRELPISRAVSLSITKLQEGVMWLGMELKDIADNNPGVLSNPYPGSKDPSVRTIEPTADNLRL